MPEDSSGVPSAERDHQASDVEQQELPSHRATRGLGALPPALILGLTLDVVQRVWSSLADLENWGREPIFLAWVGIRITMLALSLYGVNEFAGTALGRTRRGLQLATLAYLAATVETVTFAMYLGFTHHAPHWIFTVEWWVSFAFTRAIVVGFAVAAWNRTALVIILLELIVYEPVPVFRHLVAGLERSSVIWWQGVRSVLHVLAVGILATMAQRRSRAADESRAARGLRLSSRALWFRVASAVGSGTMIAVAFAQRDDHARGGIAVAFVLSVAVGVGASVVFARGLLDVARAELPELGRWPFVVAAAATFWCAGVTLHQLPALYAFLVDGDDHRAETIRALPLATALALLAALAITALAIATAAGRRGDDALRAYATSRGLGGVLLVSGSIAVIAAVRPEASAVGGLVSMWGFGALARLCTRAAASFEHGATLPSARVMP